MMNDGMAGFGWMGGYGGIGLPILVIVLVVGVLAWVVGRQRK